MPAPRWLADEMVGRLARYLRMLGHDTEYVRDLDDDEVLERARSERRRLITRDRALAHRAEGAVLLESVDLPGQLRSVRSAAPEATFAVAFTRCTLCNGVLAPWTAPADEAWPQDVPRDRFASGVGVYECGSCHHRYWEGTHTARVRTEVAGWLSEGP